MTLTEFLQYWKKIEGPTPGGDPSNILVTLGSASFDPGDKTYVGISQDTLLQGNTYNIQLHVSGNINGTNKYFALYSDENKLYHFSSSGEYSVSVTFSSNNISLRYYGQSAAGGLDPQYFGYLYYIRAIAPQTAFNTSINTPLGVVVQGHSTGQETYTGELEGTTIDVNFYYTQNNPWLQTSSLSTSGFYGSDFDVLINNVSASRISTQYFDVDYSYNQSNAVNFGLIISNSAAPAPVQDSNYTVSRHILPRYNGSRTISFTYNDYTDTSLFWPGDDSYGQTAAIDKYSDYFAYFEEITDNFPKNTYGSKVYITKLIGPKGEVIPLDKKNKNIFDVDVLFYKNSNILLYYTEFSSSLSEESKIFNATIDESGVFYKTVFYFRPDLQDTAASFGFDNSVNGLFPLDLFDTRILDPVTSIIQPYYEQGQGSLFDARYNLYSLNDGDYNNLYFKYNVNNPSIYANSITTGSGYFMGLALILANTYVTSSIPSFTPTFDKYADYYPIRFNPLPTFFSPKAGINYEVDTDLLPVRKGDYVRIFNAAVVDQAFTYKHDRDILFFRKVIDEDNIPFPPSRGLVSYDRKITDISFNLPTIFIPVFT